ncbi:hypothetical protein FRB94_005538 [Tulasnella sp. JGI-2019a]|nr:hypothetical protein FRB93_006022 [Tulasnella sp. JGI-2019a]KAG9012603.1 hypothetical protein FRB94_005538 [Tulasnella sp. JGI-2019a]KAG9038294.1 hypothetical protein FRB95_002255 [Tulasnella sp. JGI-2019a]
MSDPSASASSSGSSAPNDHSPRKNEKRPGDKDKKDDKPTTIQNLVPTVVSVKTPDPADVPLSTCIAWNQSTIRSQLTKRHKTITVCWTRLPKQQPVREKPPLPVPVSPLTSAMMGFHRPTSLKANELPAELDRSSKSSISGVVESPPSEETSPKEIPFLSGTLLAVHVHNNLPAPPPFSVGPVLYPNGAVRGVSVRPAADDMKDTTLGCEWHDSSGGYHYYVPMGIIHHRIYDAMVRSLQSIYAPALRLATSTTNRLQTSYSSGKQFEAWGIIWDRVSTGQGIALGGKLLNQVQVISKRSKEAARKLEEEREGRRKDGSS